MARKNLLKDLIEAPAGPVSPRLETKARRATISGALGAVSQGIADLKARAVIELDPNRIREGGIVDRLEYDPSDHVLLMASIRDHGQQVPVLVRPHPDEDDAYQIVYGRRRVLACRDLGVPVKALVRELDDSDLILAQGQENTARRDLSYIEKAHFASQMVEQGFKRKIISAALSVDKTEISRMLQVTDRIPESTIYAIGPAPSAGRPRWQKLADLIEKTATTETEAAVLAHGQSSDQRFEALMHALTLPDRRAREARRAGAARGVEEGRDPPRPPAPPGQGMRLTAAGGIIGRVHEGPETVTLTIEDPAGFGRWLISALPQLYCQWVEEQRCRPHQDLPLQEAPPEETPEWTLEEGSTSGSLAGSADGANGT